MHSIPFHPNERVISPPPGKEQEITGLRVLDAHFDNGQHVMISCWQLTAEDLQRINETGVIYLMVASTGHPPVKLTAHSEECGL